MLAQTANTLIGCIQICSKLTAGDAHVGRILRSFADAVAAQVWLNTIAMSPRNRPSEVMKNASNSMYASDTRCGCILLQLRVVGVRVQHGSTVE